MISPNPFVWLAALLPVIGYLLTLSVIRLSGRSLVTTGGRDLAGVLVSVAGLILVGPLELFFPHATASLLGVWVWMPLALLYLLVIVLVTISSRPRIIVYGRDPDELYPALLRAASAIDPSASGNSETWQIRLPATDVDLRIDATRGYDCCSVESFQPTLSMSFWNRLLVDLRSEVRQTRPSSRRGYLMMAIALALLYLVTRNAVTQQPLLVQSFRDWLFR